MIKKLIASRNYEVYVQISQLKSFLINSYSIDYFSHLLSRSNKKKQRSSNNRYKITNQKKKNVQLEQILSLNLLWQIQWLIGNQSWTQFSWYHQKQFTLNIFILTACNVSWINFFQVNVLKRCKWWLKFGHVWQM